VAGYTLDHQHGARIAANAPAAGKLPVVITGWPKVDDHDATSSMARRASSTVGAECRMT
jgi:hypothetical protein